MAFRNNRAKRIGLRNQRRRAALKDLKKPILPLKNQPSRRKP